MFPQRVTRVIGIIAVAAIAVSASRFVTDHFRELVPTPPADGLPEDPALRSAIASRKVLAEKEQGIAETVERFDLSLKRLRTGSSAAKGDLRAYAQQMQLLSDQALLDYHAVVDKAVAYRRDLRLGQGSYADAANAMTRRAEDYSDPTLRETVTVYATELRTVSQQVASRAQALDNFLEQLQAMHTFIRETQYAITDLRTFVEAYPDSRHADAARLFDNHVRLYAGRFGQLIDLVERYRAALRDTPDYQPVVQPPLK